MPASIDVDGTPKDVKYLVITPAGLALDVDAIEAKLLNKEPKKLGSLFYRRCCQMSKE